MDDNLTFCDKFKFFMKSYWRGMITVVVPFLVCPMLIPEAGKPVEKYMICAYLLIVMAVWWVTEAIPLPITSLLPVFVFPTFGVLDSDRVCQAYMADTVIMFAASLIMAYAVETSRLHVRMGLNVIRMIGYSHRRLLFGVSFMTLFSSMWITNTAATTMMVPIVTAILTVLDQQKLCVFYTLNSEGEKVPSDVANCYFLALSYFASIGGVGTLVGTGTNIAFKGLFETAFPKAPELLTFPKVLAFGAPFVFVLGALNYIWMCVYFFGMFRPKSKSYLESLMAPEGVILAKASVDDQHSKLGPITVFEKIVMLLFSVAIALFFCRVPGIFTGWADVLGELNLPADYPQKAKLDSTPAVLMTSVMFMTPITLNYLNYFRKNKHNELPTKEIGTVVPWELVDQTFPWGLCFLLGGGFAISSASTVTGLSAKMGGMLSSMTDLPPPVIILVIVFFSMILTNFSSNVAVSNVVVPVSMELAKVIKMNPLYLVLASGYSCSWAFCLPVGTPGNAVVQGAVNIPTSVMIKAGIGTSLIAAFVTWGALLSWTKVFWDLDTYPDWAAVTDNKTITT